MIRIALYAVIVAACVAVGIAPGPSAEPDQRPPLTVQVVADAGELPTPTPDEPVNSTPSEPAPTTPDETPAPGLTATQIAEGHYFGDGHDHGPGGHDHVVTATDIDLAVLVTIAATSDRYDTPAASRRSYLTELATSDVADQLGTLTDTERNDRVVKMSTLVGDPIARPGETSNLIVVDVDVDVTTFSATTDRSTVTVHATVTVDTSKSTVIDVELTES